MPITVEIKLSSDGKEGIDMEYVAIPGEDVTDDEIDMSNAVIALCTLMDDEEFNVRMGELIKSKLNAMQNFKNGGLLM